MASNYILELARRRKTARRFSPEPVRLEDVLSALEAGCQAPSGANSQPWRFILITDSDIKTRIREACERGEREFYQGVSGEFREWLLAKGLSWRKPFLGKASILVLVLSEAKAPYSTESVWLALGYILLAMEELGLDTVTYTPSDTQRVLEAVDVPEGFGLQAILPIGISADDKPKEPRFDLGEVAYLNFWGRHLIPLE